VATSRAVAYLGSRKNVVGCLGGMVGLGLGAAGFGGSWWWVLVVGLYAAGALATPPARVEFAADGSESLGSGAIRTDLATLLARIDATRGRLPDGAHDRIRETAALLFEILDHPDTLAGSPEQAYAVARVVRSDLPTSLATYLALPKWYAAGRPGDELRAQLALIQDDTRRLAEAVYAADARRLADHTRYLRDRAAETRPSTLEEPDA
jgi:hypothetical protein